MPDVLHTGAAIPQPIRGTTIASLGSAAFVAAYHDGTSTVVNDLTVPAFGQEVHLHLACTSATTLDKPATIVAWRQVLVGQPSDAGKSYPKDYAGLGNGAGGLELWVPSAAIASSAISGASQIGGQGAKVTEAVKVPLDGAIRIRLVVSLAPGHAVIARFVS